MGVVIRAKKIVAAGVQFPLAQPGDMPYPHLGTRHRAAVGLARVSDALAIVVSEETGSISLAEGQSLTRGLSPQELRELLLKHLEHASTAEEDDAQGVTSAPPDETAPEKKSEPVTKESVGG
jgi:diadenylate cyclase